MTGTILGGCTIKKGVGLKLGSQNLRSKKGVKVKPGQIFSSLSYPLSSFSITNFNKKTSNNNYLFPHINSAPEGVDHNAGPGIGGGQGVALAWFRQDLRLHDNECLKLATQKFKVLPFYCFDPREFQSKNKGQQIQRRGPQQMQFIIDAIKDLRKQLKDLGGDLIVRIGKPEEIIRKLIRDFKINQVFCHTEISREDLLQENKVKNVVEEEGAKFKALWGSTLYHREDLPMKLPQVPKQFGEFWKKIQKSKKIRKVIEKPNKINFAGLGNTDPGKIPTLSDLGVVQTPKNAPQKACIQGGNALMQGSSKLIGGESEGVKKVDEFIQLMLKQKNSHHGAVFVNKVSPWLSLGCVSPREIYERMNRASSKDKKVMQVLSCELVWRDYFRFQTRKLTESKTCKQKSSNQNLNSQRSLQPCAALA